MALTKIDTGPFSDVELAAKSVAEDIRRLQSDFIASKQVALLHWKGEGRVGFDDLAVAVEWQLKDISDEFWKMYEKLVEIEGAFMEADQAIGTEFATAASDIESSFASALGTDAS